MNRAEMLTHLAQRTGLHRETIKDLLKNGWTYDEKLDQPAIFSAPRKRR